MARARSEQDRKLRKDFLRVREIDGVFSLEVAIVAWPTPHTPEIRWEVAQRFAAMPSSRELRRAQRVALDNPHFFTICSTCNERCNAGHMHSSTICQGCAQKHLGIVY